ncbi:hypothetical protein FN846DRAFT_776596 [Sphaerosporella brunnea]|uniref:Uncharacterized protein n=1 Tax=Sphaerosporella brunnea TaxID=1250544 RepID=A0A5J5F178_9PEZI|nr:hypothetical protein FN846DRAFT_776596 [Sphaerosporella brunnea]
MPVIRNPFRKSAVPSFPVDQLSSENELDASNSTPSRSISAVNIVKNDDERNSYKMSVVNDSGVYLPPSPPEKKSFWRRENSSSSSKNRPAVVPPEEQFTISRESFDSYRRSFDISARSPISDVAPSRNSFDIRRPVRERASMDVHPSRISLDRSPRMPPVEEPDDGFEDVKLDDDGPRPKKLGILSRFGVDHGSRETRDTARPRSGIFSRRDHSIEAEQESELKRIDKEDHCGH